MWACLHNRSCRSVANATVREFNTTDLVPRADKKNKIDVVITGLPN